MKVKLVDEPKLLKRCNSFLIFSEIVQGTAYILCLDICVYDAELYDICSAPNLQSISKFFFQPANSGIKSTMTGRSRAVGISAPIPHLKTLQVSVYSALISDSFIL